MEVKLIVAVSANNVIGRGSELVLPHKEDLKRFKELTLNSTIIMGRKTWETLRGGLPKRHHLVLTSQPEKYNHDYYKSHGKNVEYLTLDDLLYEWDFSASTASNKDVWIIGGGEIYDTFLTIPSLRDMVSELHITKWETNVEGDVFFPELNMDVWQLSDIQHPETSDDFVFETWVKKDK